MKKLLDAGIAFAAFGVWCFLLWLFGLFVTFSPNPADWNTVLRFILGGLGWFGALAVIRAAAED